VARNATAAAGVGAGAALTATLAGACCISPTLAPLIVGTLGVSGAVALAGIKPYTPWLLGGSFLMLVYSFWSAYRRRGDCRMKPRRGVRTMLWISALIWLLAAANTLTAAEPSFATLDNGAEPIRSAFNSDIGKTRVVMLLSPT
jgi:CDP-diglyceride synthetase